MSFIQGFYIDLIAPIEGSLQFTTDPFPPGTNVFANISISTLDTLFAANSPDPTFAAVAMVTWWTYYLPDGTESDQQGAGLSFDQNAVGIQNVARINFELFAERAYAIAQINIFSL